MMAAMMKKKIRHKGVSSVKDLRTACVESGVNLIGCQMTIGLFDMKREDFIDEIDLGGATTYFEFTGDADVSLFIQEVSPSDQKVTVFVGLS